MAELMIAVGIIALLTIAGFVTMQNQSRRARDQRRQSDLEQIRQALEQFRLTSPNRTYPTVTAGAPDVVLDAALRNFLPIIPADPSATPNRRYYYRSPMPGFPADGTTYVLCARSETQPAGVSGTCGAVDACGTGTGTGCNIVLSQP